MKIILSPAKKMNVDTDLLAVQGMPIFIEQTEEISAFYGVLKPMDGVVPYRLEMQARASISGYKDLYDFWGAGLYEKVRDDSGIIINLASKEYAKCIEKYLKSEDTYITVTFGEMYETQRKVLLGKGGDGLWLRSVVWWRELLIRTPRMVILS